MMTVVDQAVAESVRSWTPPPAAAPAGRQAARAELIERSHLRCAALGLSRARSAGFEPPLHRGSGVAHERNQRLLSHATPVMEMLFEQIAGTDCVIVLTDALGTILHTIGDDAFLDRAREVALVPGINWAEQSRGTNAIGTALFEEEPTLVHGSEHFMLAHGFLSSAAAPIFDPRGNILGVLDVTGDQRSYHQHTMGLVRMSTRMIENHWLCDDFRDRLRLHLHSRAECIGTLLEGIVVVGLDGKVLGANRSALDLLALSSPALRMHSLASLFGTTASMVFEHFRAALPRPMCLSLPDGRQFHVKADLNGCARSMLAGLGAGETIAPGVALHEAPPLAARPSQPAAATPCARLSALHLLKTGDAQTEAMLHKVQRVLNRDIPLLILGETGTGKELLARAVHQDSNRAGQAFVAVNCASIPESLIEAELFGYEDGAFTGARKKGAPGRLVQANGGTLFLDEIGDMPLSLQARLLRVLQERCVTPLGSTKSIPVDIALIGATHRNLREMIDAGLFREDLYYRLNGMVARLPALRDRSDLGVVARRILMAEFPDATPRISPAVMALFERYAWPGNIRQLANVLRTAAVMAMGEEQITELHLTDDFLDDVRRRPSPAAKTAALPAPPLATALAERETEAAPAPVGIGIAWPPEPIVAPPALERTAAAAVAVVRTLGEAEIEMMHTALAAAKGNISAASKRLGISRNTIYRKLRWCKTA